MAYKNGIFEIGTLGTLTDFFTILKTKVLEYTDWELLESTEISLTFDTKIHGVTLKITDAKITDVSSSLTSNYIKLEFIRDNISTASFNNIQYSLSVASSDTTATRSINLFVHKNNNAILINFSHYGVTSWAWGNVFGSINSKSISDNTETQRYIVGSNFYSAETGNYLLLKKDFTNPANNGISMINLHLINTNNFYFDYVPYLYNCTQLSSGKYYTINGKEYFSIDSNILIEE